MLHDATLYHGFGFDEWLDDQNQTLMMHTTIGKKLHIKTLMCSRVTLCNFLVVFALKKVNSDRKPSQKRKKRGNRETQQALSGHNGTLFNCSSLSPKGEMKTFELLEHPASLLSLPCPLLSLESLHSS
jgi:hypothetical protein